MASTNFEEASLNKYIDYIHENKELFNNKLIKEFLKNKDNEALLINAICNSSKSNTDRLNEAFKDFYFSIRFTSYISSALYFNAINFDKKNRKLQSRNLLTLDKPIKNTEVNTFKEMIHDEKAEIKVDSIVKSENIIDYIENTDLYEAVKGLTKKQIEILSLAYIYDMSDTEIGIILNKSQQTVSKTHRKALKNIYDYLTKREKEDGYN